MQKLIKNIEQEILRQLPNEGYSIIRNLDEAEARFYVATLQKVITQPFMQKYWNFLLSYDLELTIYGVEMSSSESIYADFKESTKYEDFWNSSGRAKRNDEERFYMHPFFDKRIKKDNISKYFYPYRLQIAMNEIYGMYIDFEPSEYGEKGQIIFTERDTFTELVVANSFEELLQNYFKDLTLANYVYSESSIFYAPDGDLDQDVIDRYENFIPDSFLEMNEC